MKHDVFISHHPDNSAVAAKITAALLGAGIRSSLPDHTLQPSSSVGEANHQAIDASRVLLLVHSTVANGYEPIIREVRRAFLRKRKVILLRMEDIPLSATLADLVGNPPRINGFHPPLDAQVKHLVEATRLLLEAMEPPPAPPVVGIEDPLILGLEPKPVPVEGAAQPDELHTTMPTSDTPPNFQADVPQAVSSFSDGLNDLRKSQSIDAPARLGTLGQIDHYEILRKLGEGGMGVVLLAINSKNGQQVAVKTIKSSYVGNTRAQHRFTNEAKHMQRMNHPHILRVLDISDRPTGAYYVMPYIDGGSLAGKIDPAKPMEIRLFFKIARQVADALRFAHDEGVIHRDIKPENVLIDASENTYLADFGLLRTVFNDTLPDNHQVSWTVGTRPYMAPEIVAGKAGDTRADIYSFGAMLYEMATGRAPYFGDSAEEVMTKIKLNPPPKVRELNPHFPPELAMVIEAAMGRELRDRYAHMADVLADLERAENGIKPVGPHDLSPISIPESTMFDDATFSPADRRRRPLLISKLAGVIVILAAAVGIAAYMHIKSPPPNEKVIAAIDNNDVAALENLINTYDFSKVSLPVDGSFVRHAMDVGHEKQALLLLNLIPDKEQLELPDSAGNTLLHLAAQRDMSEAVQLIHSRGVQVDIPNRETHQTPLQAAVLNGKVHVAEALVDSGADPDLRSGSKESPRELAIKQTDIHTREQLVAAVAPLQTASPARDPEPTRGIDPTSHQSTKPPVDVTAAQKTISDNDLAGLTSLIQNYDFSGIPLADEKSPVRMAIKQGREEHALALLALVQPNQLEIVDPAGDTLLDLAARYDLPRVITRMHNQGAVIDSLHDNSLQTPLYIAVFHRKIAAAAALVQCGADPLKKSGTNQSPRELAMEIESNPNSTTAGQLIAALNAPKK